LTDLGTDPLGRSPSESAIFGLGSVGHQDRSAARPIHPLMTGEPRAPQITRGSPSSLGDEPAVGKSAFGGTVKFTSSNARIQASNSYPTVTQFILIRALGSFGI
jgi:hypothetical protein